MKKLCCITLLLFFAAGGTALASDDDYGPGRMMDGYGMGSGRGPMGYHMMDDDDYTGRMGGRGMMHRGQADCFAGMGGYGMMHGPGMMNGYGMRGGMGMMGPRGQGMTYEQRQKFLNDTVELRKEMHDLRFKYMEAQRDPDTTLEKLGDLEQKMLDLRREMFKKLDRYRSK